MKTSFTIWIRILCTASVLATSAVVVQAQWPAAITIEPPDATAYDEMTLIFDPAEACFQSGGLAGLPYIAMHSGVTFLGGNFWQNVVPFNSTGYNGQLPYLIPTGDGRYAITYTPADFYGLTGQTVTHICAVFNNGTDWTQDGRDFLPDSATCFDFFISINFPWAISQFHFILNMNKLIQEGSFDPVLDSIFAEIDQTVGLRLNDDESDGIYEGLYNENLVAGQNYDVRFRINEDHYEDITRNVTMSFTTTYVTAWWNDEPDPDASLTIVDFEDGTTGPLNMHVMGCGEYDYDWLHPVSETFYIVDNPGPSELNPSAKVMKFIRRGLWCGSSPWGGFWAQCLPEMDVTFLKYIHVKVWKPRISPLVFKLEAGTLGTIEIPSNNPQTLLNEWEEVMFDFSFMTGTYPIIAFMPDYENPLTLWDDIEIYFDDIVVNTIPYPIFVGQKENERIDFDVYPNPAHDLMIINAENRISSVSIYDFTGRELFRSEGLAAGIHQLGLNMCKPGIYVISAISDQGSKLSRKFVKN